MFFCTVALFVSSNRSSILHHRLILVTISLTQTNTTGPILVTIGQGNFLLVWQFQCCIVRTVVLNRYNIISTTHRRHPTNKKCTPMYLLALTGCTTHNVLLFHKKCFDSHSASLKITHATWSLLSCLGPCLNKSPNCFCSEQYQNGCLDVNQTHKQVFPPMLVQLSQTQFPHSRSMHMVYFRLPGTASKIWHITPFRGSCGKSCKKAHIFKFPTASKI